MTTTPRTTPEEIATTCTACGAAIALDQRYCLECGARSRPPAGHPLLDSTPPPAHIRPSLAGIAFLTGPTGAAAAVGCLLLAMGVGVLIGRSAGSAPMPVAAAPPPQVISVSGGGAAGASPAAVAGFTDDWPAGKSGYTVELARVDSAEAVAAAKKGASDKGAKGVGALASDNFKGLGTGSFVVYSGVYSSQAQAQKALARLKPRFPKARVIAIKPAGSHGAGSAAKQPAAVAAPAAIQQLQNATGQDYVKKSKALPNKIVTGGAPPKIDTSKPAGGGTDFSTIG